MHGLSFWLQHRLPHVNVSKSNFWIGQSLFSILQSLTHPVDLLIRMLVGVISISSFFSSWKLDYFFDMNNFIFLNPANHINLLSVILESDIDPVCIHWTLTPFQLEKFQVKVWQCVYYIIWESQSTKIIVARLLKFRVSYPEVYLYH